MKTSSMKTGSFCPEKGKGGILKRLWGRAKVGFMAVLASMVVSNAALATDLMGSGKDDVVATFGPNSLVMVGIIIAEIILGVAAYMKSRSPLSLVGLAIVIVFTTVGFTYIS
ncbi:type IV conjugative transfer system pilin TraA [Klebsiella aerogenes]|uniref:type IV conjugative transfer system pilin TraA n=1 Tax=Klebsiella aerogenes TaxID=548 RepID=UPI002E374482|nr:type IV conjugative transfer system pilin TraA [Klebsiella aerogenes]MED7793153.1 type IV conjugative transfer system pilin TraA [Klebsiella aerogenes]